MRCRLPLVTLACVLGAACGDDDDARECSSSSDCLQGGISGTCLPSPESGSQWCAYPDPACPSGERWGLLAGDGLAEACVDALGADGGMDAATVDASPTDAAAHPDAGIDSGPGPDGGTLGTAIIVAASGQDSLFVYDAVTLAALDTVTLPDREGVGNTVASVDGGTLWVLSNADVLALDPQTYAVRSGYPVNFPDLGCSGTRAFAGGGRIFCQNLGSVGTGDDRIEVWEGDPVAFSTSTSLPSPRSVGGSATRILVSFGTSDDTVAVLAPTLTPVAGSPLTASEGSVFRLEVSDPLNRIAIAGGSTLDVFDRGTLAPIGTGSVAFGASVAGVAFDDAGGRIIVTLGDGRVGAYSATDLSELTAPAVRATETIFGTVVDPSAGRVYALTQTRLIVLDLASLDHVPPSPIILPAPPADVTFN